MRCAAYRFGGHLNCRVRVASVNDEEKQPVCCVRRLRDGFDKEWGSFARLVRNAAFEAVACARLRSPSCGPPLKPHPADVSIRPEEHDMRGGTSISHHGNLQTESSQGQMPKKERMNTL